MKKRIITCCLLVVFIAPLWAGELSDYLMQYRNTGTPDYKAEMQLLDEYKLKKLIKELKPFYLDSMDNIRQKAFYLTYKKGIQSDATNRSLAVAELVKGCTDKSGGIVGSNLSFLKEFKPEDFTLNSKINIELLLTKRHIRHFKKLVLLAGYVNVGNEILNKMLLSNELPFEKQWYISLALARQGDDLRTLYCLQTAKKYTVDNNFVNSMVPDLLYTRQRSIINYCIDIIKSEDRNCYTSDPDHPQKIRCSFRVLELIAPVIEDFILKTDGTGGLVTDDYEKSLEIALVWFQNNAQFSIRTSTF